MTNMHRLVAPLVALTLAISCHSAQADTIVRVSSFEYDNSATGVFTAGLLTREVIEPLGGNPGAGTTANDCLQTSYSFDGYGNKTGAGTEPCAGATGYAVSSAPVGTQRSATSVYAAQSITINSLTYNSPAGAVLTTSTNALSQSEIKTYDPRFGAVASLTGPNGLSTTWTYDGFGRKTRETRADGTYTTWAYTLCTPTTCPPPIAGAVSDTVAIEQSYAVNAVASAPEKRQYHDTLGRVVRVQTKGFDGVGTAPTLYQDTEYNALGQVARKSNMYKAGDSPVWSSYLYDALGRVTGESLTGTAGCLAGDPTTKFAYNALVSTTTDAKCQTKTTTKNAQGQVAQVTDALNNTVSYSYNALGQLLSTNAAGSITSMSYNHRGQKIAMLDPAMGHWVYAYNVFGELVYQRDSLNQSATMEYDKLGRLTKRTEPDLVSQWSYDKYVDNSACAKGIGKLCEATTTNGYNRKHSYDPMGRASSTVTLLDASTIPVTSATVGVAYEESTGRVASKTYPGNYEVRYTYSDLGYLKSVAGGVTTTPPSGFAQNVSYDVQAMNAQGQITQYQYGSELGKKIVTTKNFDANTGRLMGQSATQDGKAAGNVLAHVYDYDKLGNLTLRNDTTTGVNTQEAFSYDSLNRLTTASILGGAVIGTRQTDVLYDARGNISYKSDVGTYWYDAARPNRMTNVTLSAPAGADQSNFTGTRALSYAYDDYRNNAQLINGTTVGNGNLEYAVTHDAGTLPGGVLRHHVRWESYTSFNMPSEIKFGNLLAASGCAAGYQLIGTNCVLESIPLPATLATATYTCAPGSTVSGSNCVNGTNTTPATLTYGCQVEYVLMYAVSCVHPQLVGSASAAQASYTCVQGTLAGTSCIVDNVSTPASVSYSCGAGLTMAGGLCITTSALTTVSTALQTVADRTLAFVYGPEHQRIKQTVMLPGTGTSAYFAGSTWYLNGEDGQGLTYEREVRTNGTVEERYFVNAGGVVFAMYASRSGTLNGLSAAQVNYLHHDQLGSVAVVTDGAGTPAGKSDAVIDRLAYDPWGKRRNINANVGNPDVGDAIVGAMTERGYTMHEHLDEMGVIHMNGRVYDPLIGRFMSADPFIQSPDNLQSYNRYSYVLNNPLYYTDPSGYKPFWKQKWFRTVVAIGVGYLTGGAVSNWILPSSLGAPSLGLSMVSGAAGGFAAGAVGSGDLKGALQGALTGGLFGAAGTVGADASPGRYLAHAAAGCVSSASGGGNCGSGAASAVFGKFATNNINIQDDVARGVATTIAGGVGSVIAGGKFENGATTAAFGYLFNCLAHKCNGADYGSEKSGFHEYGPMEQQLCNESQGGCMAAARQQLMCNSAPGQASCGSPGRLVENNLSGGNPVTQYAVNPDMIINGTSPGHVFHDGYVVRWLSVNEAGNVSVWTYGRGNNSNLATQIGNQVGGSLIFLKKGAENRAGVRRALNE